LSQTPRISGLATVRPTRVVMFFEPTPENFFKAVNMYSAAWGGVYNFMVPANAAVSDVENFAFLNDVDCVVPLHKEDYEHELARTKGYTWAGWSERHPFHDVDMHDFAVVLSSEYFVRAMEYSPFFYSMDYEDPLRHLFALMCGVIGSGSGNYGSKLISYSEGLEIDAGSFPSRLALERSVIEATKSNIRMNTESVHAITIVDPSDIIGLMKLWNLRAHGVDIFPWPVGQGSRAAGELRKWIAYKTRHGSERASRVFCHSFVEGLENDALVDEILQEEGDILRKGDVNSYLSERRSTRPMTSTYSDYFDVLGVDQSGCFKVPIPRVLPPFTDIFDSVNGMIVAVLNVNATEDLEVGYTFKIPHLRSVNSKTISYDGDSGGFERPTYEGQAISTTATTVSMSIRPRHGVELAAQVLDVGGFDVTQSETGVFAGHVIRRLGGTFSVVSNQPAYRAIIQKAARSTQGLNMAQLISEAKRYRGSWPRSEFRAAEYPTSVVYSLLSTEIIRPHLSVKCPSCKNRLIYSPADLRSDSVCDFCLKPFPLGLAIGLDRKQDWVYKLAGNISPERLRETLPIMAVLSTLFIIQRGYNRAEPIIATGVKLTSAEFGCEVDVAFFDTGKFRPELILGEVKSYRDDIEEQDVRNLLYVQRALVAAGIRSRVLFATLHERLTTREKQAIQKHYIECDAKDDYLHGTVPNLPVVFTASDLSSHWLDNVHPRNWIGPGAYVDEIAERSCEKNLDLVDVQIRPDGTQGYLCTFASQ
jgi:hypothetical protein